MHLNVHVDGETTASQFVALANLFNELSGVPATARVQPPVDSAELDEPELVVVPAETKPAVTRRRRTKAELEAEAAANKGPFYWHHPESSSVGTFATRAELDAAIASEPLVEEVNAETYAKLNVEYSAVEAQASTSTVVVEQPPVDEFEKVAATTTAPAAGGKTFTEAEAQQLATVIARTKGPQVVKDKIAELGAVRIGDLTADQLNELGNFLEAQK